MRSTFQKYDPCVTGLSCEVECDDCMVSLISDRFLGQNFIDDVLSKKYAKTRNLFTYVLIADTIGCNLNCWFCYAWKYLKLEDAEKITHHFLSPEDLARQFQCKIRKTANLAYIEKKIAEKTAFTSSEQEKILKHVRLELPFTRIRVSGGEPLFSDRNVLKSDFELMDPIQETILYWIVFFEEFDKLIGKIKAENLINIAPHDSEWQHFSYPVWLTEAQDRIMVRFDTNGLIFANRKNAELFHSGLHRLFKEGKLNHTHIQIDYSFKGVTTKEFLWSQRRGLPAVPDNNNKDLGIERNIQIRGLQNVLSTIDQYTSRDQDFKECVSVTIEKGIDHDTKSKLWLYYPGALNWEELSRQMNIEFSDVINYFDLNFGWRVDAKIMRYAMRGGAIKLTNGIESVDILANTIQEIKDFRRSNYLSKDFKILVYPVEDSINLIREKKSIDKQHIEIPLGDQNYWIITGTEENLRVGLNNGLWGVNRGLEALWTSLKEDDLVFFYCTRPISGIVGYGKVISKLIDNKPFWSNENPNIESKYPLRIRFEKLKVVDDWIKEKGAIYETGIDFFRGLNYVVPSKKIILFRKIDNQ